ncbi:amyloid beta A4 precursor protein-binding family B member 1-interacting protein isoform X2 [Oryzias melastigma]|uniref:Amyloid beta A4 precursor protein-binding family B member 1-interacting protein n=1 Tax=Oryzias melastigma TaxID=30732 RepID=A0A3B3BLD4_ORYME|nr:amyloid beta A4 precursor protein-binding family B member 1-interacting protein isoform X2 [Oryzias melastigma]XP_024130017.1 amyloid beta A4 precursor protein-binding family B member 1-interacting protein isoform X2 [Oryzias melastigma]
MEQIDAMLNDLIGEMDQLSQSLNVEDDTAEVKDASQEQSSFSIGFTDLKESLNELEDQDLDALVADLESKSSSEELPPFEEAVSLVEEQPPPALTHEPPLTVPPEVTEEPSSLMQTTKAQTKLDKIKMALEKLKEAKVRKLIVKVLMSDGSSKTLMVDGRQTVREVLDTLFEKSHCDQNINWSLCETNPELQIERDLEDHEFFVELLSDWIRHSENKVHFITRPHKYVMFTDPQLFFMWKKKISSQGVVNKQTKELLIKEHFGGSSVIVPDLEGKLYLKEDGKKVWRSQYFLLRASGLYYVPKGKTKSSSDLACFVRFEKVNVYTTSNYREKFKAPTSFCFVLKHPCIQKDSPYIKILCCEDEDSLLLWVTSIRIAKYGPVLYQNYQEAVKRLSILQTVRNKDAPRLKDQDDQSNGNTFVVNPCADPSPPAEFDSDLDEPPPNFIPPSPPRHATP